VQPPNRHPAPPCPPRRSRLAVAALAGWLCAACDEPAQNPFPLQDAASQNASSWIDRYITEGHDPHMPDDRGFTPMHVAATSRIAKHLIALGVAADPVADGGTTPLHVAVLFERTSLAKLLVKEGANVHAVDEGGWQAIHYAAAGNDPRNLRTLLKGGGDPQARTPAGERPLDIARRFDNPRCVRLLER